MRAINYKSDFDFIPKLKDRNGKEVRFPDCDWEAVLWVSNKANNYKVSRKGEQYTNCFVEENGDVHFVVNGHHLGIGVLKWDLHVALPNEIYPDGLQHLCWPESLDIELVAGAGDCPTTAELEAMLPYIKGEPFTYDDFTPEQIAELQKPATDAAASVSELETNIQETEALRKDAEQTRISNENSRTSAENDRVRDENIRKANETSRQSDETSRQSNETARVSAENARAEEFAAWQDEIDSKADRSELSNIVGVPAAGEIEDLEPTLVTNALRKTEQALTPSEQAQVKKNLGISKMELFVDMWTRCYDCQYDATKTEKPFTCNGVELTYEEAIDVYNAPRFSCNNSAGLASLRNNVKTIICSSAGTAFNSINLNANFNSSSLIALNVGGAVYVNNLDKAFMGCINLQTVKGVFHVSVPAIDRPFYGCVALKNILLHDINASLSFADSPLLSLDSIQYMVDNASNTSPITITLHPDAYARLTDGLIASAAAKNINFATV